MNVSCISSTFRSVRILMAIVLAMLTSAVCAQIVPTASGYNEDVVWSQVFTQGPVGKVNRGIVDSAGDCVAVSMPEDLARVTKVNGENGVLAWTVTINNRVGFGICEIPGDGHPDYIVSGGALKQSGALVDETPWFDRRNDVGSSLFIPGRRGTIRRPPICDGGYRWFCLRLGICSRR